MNNKITKLNLDVLSRRVEADYMDGDILLIDDAKNLLRLGSLQTDMLSIIICTKGKLKGDLNSETFTAEKSDMIVCPPHVFLDNYMITPDFSAKIIGLSYDALQRMLRINKNIWDMMVYLSRQPVYHLSEKDEELMNNFYSLLHFKLQQTESTYHRDVMQALFQAFFYNIFELLSPMIQLKSGQNNAHVRQGDLLLQRFLKLLADSQGTVRSVTIFAQKLCISAKYLSTVCKANSGKTALEWIHEYTLEVITQQLKYSDRTIKEIAYNLKFPNSSFFGKFVKAKLGVSPMRYRKQLAETRDKRTDKTIITSL